MDLLEALAAAGGNKTKAAELLGIPRTSFRRQLGKLTGGEMVAGASTDRPVIVPANSLPPITYRLTKRIRFLAYSCKHVPFHDPEAIRWLCRQIEDFRPDVVIDLGDGIDANAASRWPDAVELGGPLEEEYRVHGGVLRQIREVSMGATMIYLAGNHDGNVVQPGRVDPRLRSLVDWTRAENQPELAKHWQVNTEYAYDRLRGCFRLGQVVFAHGYEAGLHADKAQALYFCDQHGLLVDAHTHRPKTVQPVEAHGMSLPYWFANVGTMRDLDPNYVKRHRKMTWGQACVVGEVEPPVPGRPGRYWSAETRIFRFYDEWAQAQERRAA